MPQPPCQERRGLQGNSQSLWHWGSLKIEKLSISLSTSQDFHVWTVTFRPQFSLTLTQIAGRKEQPGLVFSAQICRGTWNDKGSKTLCSDSDSGRNTAVQRGQDSPPGHTAPRVGVRVACASLCPRSHFGEGGISPAHPGSLAGPCPCPAGTAMPARRPGNGHSQSGVAIPPHPQPGRLGPQLLGQCAPASTPTPCQGLARTRAARPGSLCAGKPQAWPRVVSDWYLGQMCDVHVCGGYGRETAWGRTRWEEQGSQGRAVEPRSLCRGAPDPAQSAFPWGGLVSPLRAAVQGQRREVVGQE